MNSRNCQDYDNCVQSELEYLNQPADKNSLYANRIYDDQVANSRCYNKLEAIEGFHDGYIADKQANMFKKFLCFLISVVAIILAVVLCCSCKKKKHVHDYMNYYNDSPNVIRLNIPTEQRVVTSSYNPYN